MLQFKGGERNLEKRLAVVAAFPDRERKISRLVDYLSRSQQTGMILCSLSPRAEQPDLYGNLRAIRRILRNNLNQSRRYHFENIDLRQENFQDCGVACKLERGCRPEDMRGLHRKCAALAVAKGDAGGLSCERSGPGALFLSSHRTTTK